MALTVEPNGADPGSRIDPGCHRRKPARSGYSPRQNVCCLQSFRKPSIVGSRAGMSEVYMDVRKVREWLRALVPGVALVVLATLSSVQVISAAEARKTFEDRFAEQDIRDAAQDIDRMHRILGAELQRLASRAGGSESDEVLPYLQESSGKPMDLGDVRIALSTRYIERERRQMVAAIALYKAEMAEDCGDPSPDANQLLDAAVRAKVMAALKCHQRQLDRLQSGLHKILQGYAANVVQLKLPPFT
jgi:hypothetical protein